MKKNILAVALVAGLGLAGAAAAYNYGTAAFGPSATTGDTSSTSPAGILTPENVAYQMLFGPNYNYTMAEDLVFDIQVPDNAVQLTTGFTVRVKLNRNACVPVAMPPGAPVPAVDAVCADTLDGALFNTANTPVMGTGPGQLELNATLVAAGWQAQFDAYYDGGRTASIRIIPAPGNNANPGPGEMLRWHGAQLTSLNEFAIGTTTKVDAEFWMVNASNDTRFTGSTQSRTILNRVSGVTACANSTGADVDKYIDVADSWTEEQLPKTRFSEDGKLGTAEDVALSPFTSGRAEASQVIDLGDVTITNANAGNFAFLGTDRFTTVITGGNGDDWAAFDNVGSLFDDVYLVNGTCSSGTVITLATGGTGGTVSGNSVSFVYFASAIPLPTTPGASTTSLSVCAFQDTNIVIDDHPNHVSTTFLRTNAIDTPTFGDVHLGTNTATCDLLPLRYNGSTMEIFTINPGSNTTQRSFVRLTNRGATSGYVSLEGIDNAGNRGASQVRVWVAAGASVQLDALDLENGTNGAVGAWGTGAGKWRAVVTAEFPGLVATSLVNATGNNTLQNITDSDTRGEQYDRDYSEGNFANDPGERPSDFVQESSPDFQGNGSSSDEPGGPNASDGPSGGQTTPEGNPGLAPTVP
jgi:hypothetical protein